MIHTSPKPERDEIALLRTQVRYAQTPEQRKAAMDRLNKLGVGPTFKAFPTDEPPPEAA